MKRQIVSLDGREEGMAHVVMAVLAVAVLAIIGYAGYTVANRSNPKASTSTTTTTATTEQKAASSSCVAAYHDTNLCKFSSYANIDKMVYKATLTETNAQGTSNMTLASDGKGNTNMTMSGEGTTVNTIELDGNSYVQTGGGVWYEYPKGNDSSNPANASDPTSSMNLVLGAGITYKPEGTEACGSMTCFKYQVTDSATPTVTQTVWFDNQHYLLREWKAVDSSDNSTTDMQLSYPASVNITKPSPVQVFGS